MGSIGSRLGDREGKDGIGGHLLAVLGPIDEGMAFIGDRRQGTSLIVGVSASTFHRAASPITDFDSNLIIIQHKVGSIGS